MTTIDYGMIFTTPKTPRSRRVIYLDEGTVGELRRHRRRQREEQLAAGPAWDGSNGLVFTDELGGPVHPDRFGRNFTRLVKRLGLSAIRLHDLRHTYATLALKPVCIRRSSPSAWAMRRWASPSTCIPT